VRLPAVEKFAPLNGMGCNFVLPSSTVFNFLADEIRQFEPMQLAGFSSAHVDGNLFGDAQALTR